MLDKRVKKVFRDVSKLFTYESDIVQFNKIEHWTDHVKEVENGEKFKDDCDGFALTCALCLVKAGISETDVLLILCVTEQQEQHLVCGYNDGETTQILDNRFPYIYGWKEQTQYDWISFMRLSEKGVWRNIIC